MPFWIGEAPGRTNEVSTAVSDLRDKIEQLIRGDNDGISSSVADETLRVDSDTEGGRGQPHSKTSRKE
jgi:hypothetical protein